MKGPWLYEGEECFEALGGIRMRTQIGEFSEFGRGLVIDGQVQLAEAIDALYTTALVFPAALASRSREHWLIVGGGDGAACREALRFRDTRSVHLVDLSPLVIAQTQTLVPSFWGGAHRDPRLTIECRDAWQVLAERLERGERADLILFDLTDPDGDDLGPQDPTSADHLYTGAAFALAAGNLRPGGVFVAQVQELSALNWRRHARLRSLLQQSFRHVFSYRVYVELFGYWESFLIASNEPGPWSPLPQAPIEPLLAELYDGPALEHWSDAWHRQLFTLPPALQRRLNPQPPPAPDVPPAEMRIDPSRLDSFTEVRQSHLPGAGLGLFATRPIPAGTVWWRATPESVVCLSRRQYDVLMNSHLASSSWSQEFVNAIQMFGYINDDTNELVVAIDNSRFVNHSEDPNSIPYPADPNNQAMAVRDIAAGEEITEDYRSYSMNTWDMPEEPYLSSP